MRHIKKVVSILFSLVMVFSLTACGNSGSSVGGETSSSSGTSDDAMHLSIITVPNEQLAPQLVVAEKMGYFKEQGIDVEIKYYQSLSDMASVVAGGSCDVAFNSFYTVLTWLEAGMDLRIIGANNNMGGTQAAAIRDDIKISSPKDLEGLKMGLVPGAEVNVAVRKMCDEYGVDYDAINKVEVQASEQLSAFEAGDIDIIACWEPWLVKAEDIGGRFLLSGTACNIEGIPEDVDWLNLYSTIVVTPDVMDKKAEALGKMLVAIKKASDYINENKEKTVEYLSEQFDEDAKEVKRVMDRNEYCWGVTNQYVDSLTDLTSFMYKNKIISKEFAYDSFNDFSILKKVLPDSYTVTE